MCLSIDQRNLVGHLMVTIKNSVDTSALLEFTDVQNGTVRTASNELAMPQPGFFEAIAQANAALMPIPVNAV